MEKSVFLEFVMYIILIVILFWLGNVSVNQTDITIEEKALCGCSYYNI